LESDYHLVLEIFNLDTQTVEQQWSFMPANHRYGHYSTLVWDVGEVVNDHHVFRLPDNSEIPPGSNYVMRLRVFDPLRESYLPLYINGQPTEDPWQLAGSFRIRS